MRHPISGSQPRAAIAWPDQAIATLADRQRTLLTTAQLRALGASPSMIVRAHRRGRLHPVHRGVHSLVLPGSRPPLAAEQAAVLACAPGVAVSHETLAAMLGVRLAARPTGVHLTMTGSHRRGPGGGVTMHRTDALPPAERMRVGGLPATTPARLLLDLAPRLSATDLEPLVDQVLRLTSRAKIAAVLARHSGRAGSGSLRELLAADRPSADVWSRAEARLRRMILSAGLPAPECNIKIGRYVADLLWREQRLIVEYDSWGFHNGLWTFNHDRTRHNDLEVFGDYSVLHVTGRHVLREPERVLAWIAARLSRTVL